MNIAILIFFTAVSIFARANEIHCSAQLIRSACGSGQVFLIIREDKNFNLSLGDAPCWYSDFKVSGSSKTVPTQSPFFGASTYELRMNSNNEIGSFIYDASNKVARLILNEELSKNELPTLVKKYDLVCE